MTNVIPIHDLYGILGQLDIWVGVLGHFFENRRFLIYLYNLNLKNVQ